ncbi:MAG: hypothetical protein RBU30_18945 [Polyangia bacterium]|jgi:cysteine-rich repeat protein|nr:hypothetical protein [Polyangia bacterium]
MQGHEMLRMVSSIAFLLAAAGCEPGGNGREDAASRPDAMAWCGNGVVEPGEECDLGLLNRDDELGMCRTDCRVQTCGDWKLDPGELCDDGNFLDYDSCPSDCGWSLKRCGDGVMDEGEQCDDGNGDNWDGCTLSCQKAERRVNTYLRNFQQYPSVGVSPDGSFVIVWRGEGADGNGVYARLYDTAGEPEGEPFLVWEGSGEAHPKVYRAASGEFTVLLAAIFKQDFSADGTPRGPATEIRTCDGYGAVYHDVVGIPDGRHAVVWLCQAGYEWGIYLQRFAADGSLDGSEISFPMYVDPSWIPAAMAPDGSVFVAWTDYWGTDELRAQGVGPDGQLLGETMTLVAPEEPFDLHYEPLTAMGIGASGVGTLVLAWAFHPANPEDQVQMSCKYRLFDWAGAPLGSERACLETGQVETYPFSLAMDEAGRFALIFRLYDDLSEPEFGTLRANDYLRRYDHSGTPLTVPEPLTLYGGLYQGGCCNQGPSLGLAGRGEVIIAVDGWFLGSGTYHDYPPDWGDGPEVYTRTFPSAW